MLINHLLQLTIGTIYIGSEDSNLYAINPNGTLKWKFPTGDHIYASAALGNTDGKTSSVYLASADGTLYALNTDGTLKWKYDTGDVIRSSPVVGKTPDGSSDIIYFGDGKGGYSEQRMQRLPIGECCRQIKRNAERMQAWIDGDTTVGRQWHTFASFGTQHGIAQHVFLEENIGGVVFHDLSCRRRMGL